MLKTAFSSNGSFAMVGSRKTLRRRSTLPVRNWGAVPLTVFEKMSAGSTGGRGLGSLIPELQPQRAFGICPVVFGGCQRYAEGFGDLGHGQTGEKPQLHDRRRTRIGLLQ